MAEKTVIQKACNRMPASVVVLNRMITRMGKSGQIDRVMEIFSQMKLRNVVTYNSVISALSKNGRILDARKLFDTMPQRNLISWNTMISGYLHGNMMNEACALFLKAPGRDLYTYTLMITCFTRNRVLDKARQLFDSLPPIHKEDPSCWNAMISGYSKERRYSEAIKLFKTMPKRNLMSWKSLLCGYTQNGDMNLAVKTFEKMEERDTASWNLMVEGFLATGDSASARRYFEGTPNPSTVSWVTMVNGLAKEGDLIEAKKLFDEMPERHIISWNAMITGYINNHKIQEAAKMFEEMPKRDAATWSTMIDGYARYGLIDKAEEMVRKYSDKESDGKMALICGYLRCNKVEEARNLFDKIIRPDVICWNAMIAAYAKRKRMDEAQKLFNQLENRDAVSSNTMILGYAEMGEVEKAESIFENTKDKNVVTWNSMITGLMANSMFWEALRYVKTAIEESRPDQITCASAVSSCASLCAIKVGEQMHQFAVKTGYISDTAVGNSLISLYSKCGRVSSAKVIFEQLKGADVVTWNAMIGGYAMNGLGEDAVRLYEKLGVHSVWPDDVTFVNVLSGCSHCGMVEKGVQVFQSMWETYGVEPKAEHYGCLVDLLGRRGRIEEALEVVKDEKVKHSDAAWGSLLGACRIHRNKSLAFKIAEMEPGNASTSIILSNIKADTGQWNARDCDKGNKELGLSWVEIANQIMPFSSGQSAVSRASSTLNTLTAHMRNYAN